MELFDDNKKGADFSNNGKHRYRLWRIWDETKPYALCIGLNPSTANSEKNDPTINILIKMLKSLGYGGLYMMNCFAFITSNPKELLKNVGVIDYSYNKNLIEVTKWVCKDVIFAWGQFKILNESNICNELAEMFPNAKCFGKNADGSPIHPLAMQQRNGRDPNNPQLIPFN